ncbi:hypothetical protein NHX12_017243 [Muraenolepis orangiensis]|uniref:Uncharacterized protein n=1 Tax=Muraenolepis orangiensis TaxID=630683 RepID=A0A9Q0I2B3_9TELE|nr:hypothetical protein NHX12_017243 [Muraenolepis orangiensis]
MVSTSAQRRSFKEQNRPRSVTTSCHLYPNPGAPSVMEVTLSVMEVTLSEMEVTLSEMEVTLSETELSLSVMELTLSETEVTLSVMDVTTGPEPGDVEMFPSF